MRYLVIILITLTGPVEADDGVSFRQDIAPIFIDHCLSCHAADRAEGGYRVDHYQALLEAEIRGPREFFPTLLTTAKCSSASTPMTSI